MADDIVLNIVLNGLDDIIAQLQQAGQVGSTAFDSLAEAAAKISGNVDEAGASIGKTAETSHAAEINIAALGETGTRAFTNLASTSERFVGSLNQLSAAGAIGAFEQLGSAIEGVSSKLGPLGEGFAVLTGVFAGVAAGIGGVTLGLYEFAKSGAEATSGAVRLASAAGATLEQMGGLQAAFAASGVSTENFGSQLRILGVRIASVWPEIVKAVESSTTTLADAQIKVNDAARGVAEGQSLAAEGYQKAALAALTVADAQAKVGNSADAIKSAQLGVIDAQDKIKNAYLARESAALSVEHAEYNLRVALGGGRDKDVEESLKVADAELALKKAKEQQAEASKQAARDALAERTAQAQLETAYRSQEKDVLELQRAKQDLAKAQIENTPQTIADKQLKTQLDLQKAKRDQQEAQLKDLPTIAAGLAGQSDLFEGIAGKATLARVNTEDLFKAIVLEASEAKKATGDLVPPTSVEVLTKVAENFKNITSETQKQAIARATLGRSFTESEIAALSKGPAAWKAYAEAEKQAGFTLGEVTQQSTNFNSALGTLTAHLETLKNQMAAPFAAIFATELSKLNDYVVQNRASLVAWATDLASKVKPIIEDVFKLIEGKDVDPSGFVGKLVDGAKGLLTVLTALKDVIVGVVEALTPVAKAADAVVQELGGWKSVVELIIALKLADWLQGLLTPLGGIGGAFKGAAGGAAELVAVDIAGWASLALGPVGKLAVALGLIAGFAGAKLIKEGKKPFVAGSDSDTGAPQELGVSHATSDVQRKKDELARLEAQQVAQPFGPSLGGDIGGGIVVQDQVVAQRIADLKEDIAKLEANPDEGRPREGSAAGRDKQKEAASDQADAATKQGEAAGKQGDAAGKFSGAVDQFAKAKDAGQDVTTTADKPQQVEGGGFADRSINNPEWIGWSPGQPSRGGKAETQRLAQGAGIDEGASEGGGSVSTSLAGTAIQHAGGPSTSREQVVPSEDGAQKPITIISSHPSYQTDAVTGKPIPNNQPARVVSGTAPPDAIPAGQQVYPYGSIGGVAHPPPPASSAQPVPVTVVGPVGEPVSPSGPPIQVGGVTPATAPASVTQPLPVEIVSPSPGSVPGPPRGIGEATVAPALPPSAATPVPVQIVSPPAGPIPTAPATTGPANVLPPSVGAEAAGGIVPVPAAAAATGANDLSSAFDRAAAAVSAFASSLNPITQAKAGEGGNDQGSQKLDEAGQKLDQAGGQLSTAVEGLSQAGTTLSDAAQAMDQAASAVSDAASRLSTPGHASGGFVSGPGTTTSDSIPARLSHGEYVVQARAVQHYGVNTMHAINQMHAPAMKVGGYIDALTGPAFRTGGAVQHDLLKTMDVINQQHERATVFGQLAGVPKAPGVQLAEGGLVEGFAAGGAVHHKKHGASGAQAGQPLLALPALSPHAQRESLIFQTLFAPHAMPSVAPAKIPGHKAGGLVEWLSAIPAFKAGGLVEGSNMIGGGFEAMPGFAAGGRVDHVSQQHLTKTSAGASGPYASAGGSGGQRALTLVIEGKQFPGLSGPANVVGDMERHATGSRLSRISRNNPSWRK